MARKNFKKLSTVVRRDPERAARVEKHKKAIRDSLGLGEVSAGDTNEYVAAWTSPGSVDRSLPASQNLGPVGLPWRSSGRT